MKIVQEKISLASRLLTEAHIDMWLLFVRETPVLADPMLPLLVGHQVTWESFFVYTASGHAIALVGELDAQDFEKSGCFTEVLTYVEGSREHFVKLLKRVDPRSIAINFSKDSPINDGLSHGLYLVLQDYLAGTPYASRLISSQAVGSRLRSLKSSTEQVAIGKAVRVAVTAWGHVIEHLRPGQSERKVADLIEQNICAQGAKPSFATIVNAGSKTKPGHSTPSDAIVEPGELLHVDFGAKVDYYCSDLQRLVYFLRENESSAPQELLRAFETVRDIITETARFIKPGMAGYQVDSLARQILAEKGYEEYRHGLGHQLGRSVHDGGALLGPKWPRYGDTINIELEEHNVFTLELGINLEGIGYVGLEEDIIVDKDGGRFLGPRQEELIIL